MNKTIAKVALEVSKRMGMTGLRIKAKSPEILLVCGIATMVGAVVSAIVKNGEATKVLEEHEEELEAAKAEVVEDEDGTQKEKDQKEINREVRKTYFRTLGKLTKVYGVTFILMGISTACFIGMHNIQAGRIATLSAAYEGVKQAFDEYQQRNIELNGEENHRMCKYGYKEVDEVDEDGKTVGKKKVANKPDDIEKLKQDGTYDYSYALWGRSCSSFTGDRNLDRITLTNCYNYMCDLVKARGWAIENDARDYLKLPRTPAGMINGWVRGFGEEPSLGIDSAENYEFVNGYRYNSVLLTFNTQGNVFYLLEQINKGRKAA